MMKMGKEFVFTVRMNAEIEAEVKKIGLIKPY